MRHNRKDYSDTEASSKCFDLAIECFCEAAYALYSAFEHAASQVKEAYEQNDEKIRVENEHQNKTGKRIKDKNSDRK
jgi:hypothetical protein